MQPASGSELRPRERLLRAAQGLFGKASADSYTIDQIVDAAGVAKGTFYNHFRDRQELELEVVAHARLEISGIIASANEAYPDCAAKIARCACAYVQLVLVDPERARFLSGYALKALGADHPDNAGLAAILAEGIEHGRFLVPTRQCATLLVVSAIAGLVLRILDGIDLPWAIAFSQQTCTLLLRGLGISHVDAERVASQAADSLIVGNEVSSIFARRHEP